MKLNTTIMSTVLTGKKKREPRFWEAGYAEKRKAEKDAINKRYGLKK